MQLRWLGWAGVELATGETTVVIDALGDPAAVFAAFGARAENTPLPAVTPASPRRAVAGLVTHLHRDHADAAALAEALAPGAPILEPPTPRGDAIENLGLAQAEHELAASGRDRRRLEAWETTTIGPFTLTALPAVDGLGDPQVAWLVEAEGVRVLHLGDTMFHGSWWRMAHRHGPFDVVLAPINGAVVRFPHRRPASPLPAAMTPHEAVVAATVLGARLTIPIHADGYEIDGIYEPSGAPLEAFTSAADAADLAVHLPQLGKSLDVVEKSLNQQ
jgi:L-ascorbate metabolism protein UlaG (beta-lactamase superfamily)